MLKRQIRSPAPTAGQFPPRRWRPADLRALRLVEGVEQGNQVAAARLLDPSSRRMAVQGFVGKIRLVAATARPAARATTEVAIQCAPTAKIASAICAARASMSAPPGSSKAKADAGWSWFSNPMALPG